jgi:hypothetical protein
MEAQRLEEPAGALEAMAAEDAEQLLRAVAGEEQADDYPENQKP